MLFLQLETLSLTNALLELRATHCSRIILSFYKLESPSLSPGVITSVAVRNSKESASLGDTSGLGILSRKVYILQ